MIMEALAKAWINGKADKRFLVYDQACALKLRLRELTSCLCSPTALAVCFEGRMAGLDATETGNEFSQLKS